MSPIGNFGRKIRPAVRHRVQLAGSFIEELVSAPSAAKSGRVLGERAGSLCECVGENPMSRVTSKVIAAAVAALAIPVAGAVLAPTMTNAQDNTHEITVAITHVKALDKFDEFSNGDMYGRVTIGGKSQSTPVIKGDKEVKPDWKISQAVPPGPTDVKVEIIDKDVAADDAIDINKLEKKRDLDFSVNTKSCTVEGFSQTYRCGASITRAGKEPKKAEITFKVSVKK